MRILKSPKKKNLALSEFVSRINNLPTLKDLLPPAPFRMGRTLVKSYKIHKNGDVDMDIAYLHEHPVQFIILEFPIKVEK